MDTEPRWYLLLESQISGPLTSQQVRDSILQHSTQKEQIFVWGPELNSWIGPDEWTQKEPELNRISGDRSRAHAWYCTVNNNDQQGPLVFTELIDYLRGLQSLQRVWVWRQGMPSWLAVFDCEELLLPLGLNRRKMLRAPLLGRVVINRPGDEPQGMVCVTTSISIGGIGVSEVGKHLMPGDSINLKISSLQLADLIRTKGQVLYATKMGNAGIAFLNLDDVQRKMIDSYIERFNFLKKVSRAA